MAEGVELTELRQAVMRTQNDLNWLMFAAGAYTAPGAAPGKREHQAMRKLARDVKASASEVISKTEAIVGVGKRVEKERLS